MKNFFLLLAVSALMLLSGCAASLPKADNASQIQAKSFTPKAGLSNICVYQLLLFGGSRADYQELVEITRGRAA